MEALAAQFVENLAVGAPTGAGATEAGLRVEIVSAKGLAMPLESREVMQGLQISALYRKQHVRSPTIACTSTDPLINFTTDFNVSKEQLLTKDGLIMVYLSLAPTRPADQVHCGKHACCRTLVSCAAIDPRLAYTYGGDFISVELIPCENDGITSNPGSEGPAGSLFLRLSLRGEGMQSRKGGASEASRTVLQMAAEADYDWSSEKVERAISSYQDRISRAHQDNFQLARSWFSRARREFPFLEERKIKLVAEDECGRHRFVCGFVSPLVKTPRSVDGPRYAARFVSLIPFKRDVSLSGERVSTWHSAQCTAIRMHGDVEDHALLLCSILLGWGMDAWMCYGTIYDTSGGNGTEKENERQTSFRPHYWVVTLDDLRDGRLVFWESLTGQQYNVAVDTHLKIVGNVGGMDDHPFREVYALFRHDAFLLNTQRFAIVAPNAIESESTLHAVACNFNLNDSKAWLQFPFKGEAELLRHPGSDIHLCEDVPAGAVVAPSSSSSASSKSAGSSSGGNDTYEQEAALEAKLREFLAAWRAEHGLQTRFDEDLALVLQPALAAYELDRATGVTFGNQDFQAAIKSKVHKGETFKAYPTCFGHADPLSVQTALKLTGAVRDIVLSRNQHGASSTIPESTRLAVRVRIFTYPEGTCACWVMIAACRNA